MLKRFLHLVAVLGSITLDKCGGEWGYIGADCWCITKGFLLLDQDACNSFNILVGRAHKDANQALLLILQVMGNILYVLIAWCITNPCALSQSQMFMHRRTALPSREHSASIHILAGRGEIFMSVFDKKINGSHTSWKIVLTCQQG